MGAQHSTNNSETINWNNINTDNMSVNPAFNGLSNEAKQLIASLDIPSITNTETSELAINNILSKINSNLAEDDQNKFYKLLDEVSTQSDNLSNTSPFISSEMYSQLVNSKTSEDMPVQAGGAKKKVKKQKKSIKNNWGGSKLDDDSDDSTTTTSTYSSLEDILESSEPHLKEVKHHQDSHSKSKKEHMKSRKINSSPDTDSDSDELSYLSSSAHTGGEFSNNSSSEQSTSETDNTVSDEAKLRSTSVSVNTSDINMVSDY